MYFYLEGSSIARMGCVVKRTCLAMVTAVLGKKYGISYPYECVMGRGDEGVRPEENTGQKPTGYVRYSKSVRHN